MIIHLLAYLHLVKHLTFILSQVLEEVAEVTLLLLTVEILMDFQQLAVVQAVVVHQQDVDITLVVLVVV